VSFLFPNGFNWLPNFKSDHSKLQSSALNHSEALGGRRGLKRTGRLACREARCIDCCFIRASATAAREPRRAWRRLGPDPRPVSTVPAEEWPGVTDLDRLGTCQRPELSKLCMRRREKGLVRRPTMACVNVEQRLDDRDHLKGENKGRRHRAGLRFGVSGRTRTEDRKAPGSRCRSRDRTRTATRGYPRPA
jgi:hypothetical protein